MVIVNGYDAINEALTVAGKGWDVANRREPYYTVKLYNPKKLGTFISEIICIDSSSSSSILLQLIRHKVLRLKWFDNSIQDRDNIV